MSEAKIIKLFTNNLKIRWLNFILLSGISQYKPHPVNSAL